MRTFDRMLAPLRRRLALMVARGVVALVNDGSRMQSLQVTILDGETLDGAEHWQPYGFTTVPQAGAEALVLSVGGHRAHSVVVSCGDRRYRLTGMKGGEVAIYTDEQDKVHFKRGRVIDIETHTLNIKAEVGVNIETPLLSLSGRFDSEGDQVAAGVSQIHHVHQLPGGGQTLEPV